MLRNSILYRRLWYVRRRNSGKLHIFLFLISIFVIFLLLISYADKQLKPYIEQISEMKARACISRVISSAVNDVFDRDIHYEDFVTIKRDGNNNISSVESNVLEMNRLSAKITTLVQDEFSRIKYEKIPVPLGRLLVILCSTGWDLI